MGSNGLILNVYEFCPHSQRPLVALYHCNIPFELVPFSVGRIPNWIYEASIQGILPILTEGEAIVVGSDAISAYLEKFEKIAKLFLFKKKKYTNAIIHCKTKFEPLVDRLINDFYTGCPHVQLCDSLIKELEYIDSIISGPYFLGSSVTWVDIHYWTFFQRFPLLKYLYNFEIPAYLSNLKTWLDKVNKLDAFNKASYPADQLTQWFDQLPGRGYPKPAASALEFMFLVNNAVETGLGEFLQSLRHTQDFSKEIFTNLLTLHTSFSYAFREHMQCKTKFLLKSWEKKVFLAIIKIDKLFCF